MKLEHVTYKGDSTPDFDRLGFVIPDELKSLLSQINGFIQYHGGLHIRGVCSSPDWHSLQEVMTGKFALFKNYKEILETDLFFGQDCMADQFFIREGLVYKLYSESGEIELKENSFSEFMQNSTIDPIQYLELEPLLEFQSEGNNLLPGKVLFATPPFCTEQAENGVHLGAVPITEALVVLPKMAKVIGNLADGEKFDIKVINVPDS